jgi:lipoprotein-releasing system permease protein
MLSGAGFAVRADASQSIALMGVDAVAFQRIVRMPKYLQSGVFNVDGTNTVIGAELAKDLGIVVGDKLRLVTMDGRNDLFSVAGIFDIGNRDLNRRWVFTSIKVAQSLLDLPGGITQLDLRVQDLFAADATANRLKAQTGLTVDSWMQTNAQLLSALNSQSMSNNLIRFFVTVIVAVGIASVLVVSVVQKQKEIGILRAMGASPRRIMSVFLLQGGFYGLMGSALGSALSFGLLNFFAKITRNADGTALVNGELEVSIVVSACVLAMVVGLLAAALPARRAARMDPVQAIRV